MQSPDFYAILATCYHAFAEKFEDQVKCYVCVILGANYYGFYFERQRVHINNVLESY